MNKIEKLHFLTFRENADKNGGLDLNDLSSKSAEITKDIAIRFDKWKRYFLKTTKDDYDLYLLPENPMGRWYTVEELFEIFLKTL